jgi:Leucine-rich repeat (LRR) protein
MKNLKILNLSKNNLTDTLANDIHAGGGKSIVCLPPTLEQVILSDIIHGEDLFANMIPLKLRLTKLHLSKMKLRPCDIEKLVRMLKSLPCPLSLQELVLTEVDLVDMGYEELVRVIKLLKNLKKLDLGGMKIRDKKTFVDMLSSLSFLEQLVFPDILMPDDGIPEVFEALRSLRCLKHLDIGGNAVYKTEITETNALAQVLSSLQLLEKLVLGEIICDEFREIEKSLFLAVGKLKKLKELQLQQDGFITETGAIALAEVLPSLQLLEKLVLGEIHFGSETEKQLFAAVGELKYLKEFTLHFSNISQTGAEVLAGELPALKLLEKVKLLFVHFDNGSEKLLCIALTSLKYLKELDLAMTKISQTGAVALSKLLPALQLLEKLVLGEIDFDNGSEKQLFDAVGKLKRLKKFYLGTKITQTGAITLAEVLPSLQLLEKLVLTIIDFDNGSNEQFLDSVGKLGYLKKLYLQFSEITQTGIKALTKVLGSLQLLEKLLLGHIHFYNDDENEIESKFFYALGNLRYLKELGLWSTYITQTGIVVLAEVLPSLQLLEKLVLGNIDFDNESEEKLFYAIMKLRSLKKLDLASTELAQTGTGALAEVLPSLRVLEELTLGKIDFDNTSEKQLFAAIAKSKYLKKLGLRGSKITQTGAVILVQMLPSLQLLETLRLGEIDFINNESEKQLIAAVGSLNWLKVLVWRTKITDEGAATFIGVLPTLRNLRSIYLPSDVGRDEQETPVSKIEAGIVSLVQGLLVM